MGVPVRVQSSRAAPSAPSQQASRPLRSATMPRKPGSRQVPPYAVPSAHRPLTPLVFVPTVASHSLRRDASSRYRTNRSVVLRTPSIEQLTAAMPRVLGSSFAAVTTPPWRGTLRQRSARPAGSHDRSVATSAGLPERGFAVGFGVGRGVGVGVGAGVGRAVGLGRGDSWRAPSRPGSRRTRPADPRDEAHPEGHPGRDEDRDEPERGRGPDPESPRSRARPHRPVPAGRMPGPSGSRAGRRRHRRRAAVPGLRRRGDDGGRRRVAGRRLLGHRPGQTGSSAAGRSRQRAGPGRIRLEVGPKEGLAARRRIGRATGQGEDEGPGEGIQVGPRVERGAALRMADPLGGEIGQGGPWLTRRRESAGDPEIGQVRLAPGVEEDVRGAHVAVDQPRPMDGIEGRGDRVEQLQCPLGPSRPSAATSRWSDRPSSSRIVR